VKTSLLYCSVFTLCETLKSEIGYCSLEQLKPLTLVVTLHYVTFSSWPEYSISNS